MGLTGPAGPTRALSTRDARGIAAVLPLAAPGGRGDQRPSLRAPSLRCPAGYNRTCLGHAENGHAERRREATALQRLQAVGFPEGLWLRNEHALRRDHAAPEDASSFRATCPCLPPHASGEVPDPRVRRPSGGRCRHRVGSCRRVAEARNPSPSRGGSSWALPPRIETGRCA